MTASCRDEEEILQDGTQDIETADWTEETHSNDVEPNYDIVFNQTEVIRFDIAISAEDWDAMQTDLEENLGSSTGGFGGPPMGGGGAPADMTTSDFDPIWVPCSFKFNDTEWYKVGIRYKGNSSLQFAHQSGTNKYSLKLDFDEFEDTYPDIKNQRFYGFKQLNLNNNFGDESFLREKVAPELFRSFGIPAPQTAFAIVYLDKGFGPEYMGIFTLVEEVDDTVLDSQFADGSGNLYKPDGTAASFAAGTYNASEMEKKTNEETGYEDVEWLYEIINSELRTSDYTAWKEELNAIFDVNHFLKWLAVNTSIQNWDTYGQMTHNYYLYNNSGILTWIPWDNNEAFQEGKMQGALSLSLDEVNSSWPLIRYIIDDEDYNETYRGYVKDFKDQYFNSALMTPIYENYSNMIQEYTTEDPNAGSFESAVSTMKQHVSDREAAIDSFLN